MMFSYCKELCMALSPKGRVSFPSVFEPSAFEGESNPKFSVTLVFDPSKMDEAQLGLLKEMKAAANKAAQEAFGGDVGGYAKEGGVIRSPFRKTDEKPKFYEPGQYFVRFANKYKPNVVDGRRQPIDPHTDDFYAGCWAHVSYEVYTYDYMGNKGVSFSLGNVQKTGDDEPFGNRKSSAEDDFDIIEAGAQGGGAPGGDDDIPF